MHFSCRPFIGRTTDSDWSQYWENEPDDLTLKTKFGHLFGLVHLNSNNRQLIDQINQSYFSLPHPNPQVALSNAISLVSNSDIALISVVNLQAFIVFSGSITIVIRRHGQISQIGSGSAGNVITGPVSDQDQIFVASTRFFDSIGIAKINRFLSLPTLQSIEENFLSELYTISDQSSLAAVLIQIHFDESDVVEPAHSQPSSLPSSVAPSIPTPQHHHSLQNNSPSGYVVTPDSSYNTNRRRWQRIASVALFLVLIISSLVSYRRHQQSIIESRYRQLVSDMDKKIADSKAIRNLNLSSSLETAKQANDILTQVRSLNVHQSELSSYEEQINTLLRESGAPDSFSLEPFYDTSTIVDPPQFSQALISKGQLYLLDPINGRVDLLNLKTKSIQKVAASDTIKGAISFAEYQKDIYLIKQSGVFRVSQGIVSQVIEASDPIDIGFWNGSLYLLTSTTIQKYQPNSSGFGPAQVWLKNGVTLPSSPSSLAINGNLWVLGNNGTLRSYLRGEDAGFKPSSTYPSEVSNYLTTTANGSYISYSSDNSQIYTYQKTGELKSKHNLGNKTILDLSADPDSSNVYILASDFKIYQITP